ncbi:MAG: response regulator transcription factor [Acidobacteriota bacterium]|nr:response regulator transcription factor [Acidobacteriota bacterium]
MTYTEAHCVTYTEAQIDKAVTNLLLVDDDLQLGGLMTEYFDPNEFAVAVAATGEEAIGLLQAGKFSIVILDVMLPGIDGFAVLRQIRKMSDIPVLMLTTRGATSDRVNGLELGADDYLPKPFQPEELQARLRSIIRRAQPRGGRMKYVTIDDLELDEQGRLVKRAGEEIELTGAEFFLLQLLLSQPGTVYPREALIEKVFNRPPTMFDRSIDSLVSNLRRKLGPATKGHDRIRSVRGIGYAYTVGREKDNKH